MSEPYEAKKIPDHWKSTLRRRIVGKTIAISGLRLKMRGTWLMHPRTRALPKYTVLELTVTEEEEAAPGSQVNSVLYVGFFEVQDGGVVVVGDPVSINKSQMGTVAGFSDIHCPNHLNIMVKGDKAFVKENIESQKDRSVVKLAIKIEDEITFGRAK